MLTNLIFWWKTSIQHNHPSPVGTGREAETPSGQATGPSQDTHIHSEGSFRIPRTSVWNMWLFGTVVFFSHLLVGCGELGGQLLPQLLQLLHEKHLLLLQRDALPLELLFQLLRKTMGKTTTITQSGADRLNALVLSLEPDPEFPPLLSSLHLRHALVQIPKKHFAQFPYPRQPWSGITTMQCIMLMNEEWSLLQHTIIAASQGQLELRKTAATLDEICCHYSLHRTAELVMSQETYSASQLVWHFHDNEEEFLDIHVNEHPSIDYRNRLHAAWTPTHTAAGPKLLQALTLYRLPEAITSTCFAWEIIHACE